LQTLLLLLCGTGAWTVVNAASGDAPSSSCEIPVTSGRIPTAVDAGITTVAFAPDSIALLTAFEKARERNDVGR
jgi:hypothetical protein